MDLARGPLGSDRLADPICSWIMVPLCQTPSGTCRPAHCSRSSYAFGATSCALTGLIPIASIAQTTPYSLRSISRWPAPRLLLDKPRALVSKQLCRVEHALSARLRSNVVCTNTGRSGCTSISAWGLRLSWGAGVCESTVRAALAEQALFWHHRDHAQTPLSLSSWIIGKSAFTTAAGLACCTPTGGHAGSWREG